MRSKLPFSLICEHPVPSLGPVVVRPGEIQAGNCLDHDRPDARQRLAAVASKALAGLGPLSSDKPGHRLYDLGVTLQTRLDLLMLSTEETWL